MSTTTLTDLMNEVRSLAHELNHRVDESDKEQKRRGEELTSKNATTSAEIKEMIDRVNARINTVDDKINELETEQKQAQIAANRPPAFTGKKQKRSDAHQAWMKAIKTRDGGMHLTTEEKQLILPAYMPREQKALYAADATTGGYFAATDFLDELLAYRLLVSPMRKVCRLPAISTSA